MEGSIARGFGMDGTRRRQPQTTAELRAARAAILALRVSLPQSTRVSKDVIFFGGSKDSTPVTDDKAAAVLVTLPKPTTCRGTPDEGGLAITCHTMDGDAVRSHQEFIRELLGGLRQVDQFPKAQDALLLIRGRDEEVVLVLQEFERWCLDYELPPGVAMTGKSATDDQARKGVRYVFVLSTPRQIER
jgi:hypothetical protein